MAAADRQRNALYHTDLFILSTFSSSVLNLCLYLTAVIWVSHKN